MAAAFSLYSSSSSSSSPPPLLPSSKSLIPRASSSNGTRRLSLPRRVSCSSSDKSSPEPDGDNNVPSSPGHSSNGSSFRRSGSVMSAHSVSRNSASSKFAPSKRRVFKGLNDYSRKFVDLELFTHSLEDWVLENSFEDSANGEQAFSAPFMMDELRKLDLALEGVLFQQLLRMPCSSYVSGDAKEDEYLALEDFLHAIVSGLWHAFWHKRGQPPMSVTCPRGLGSKFYTVEKAKYRSLW